VGTSVSIDSVTTEDAAPTTAPHRISNVTGKKTVTVKFTVDEDYPELPSSADGAYRVNIYALSAEQGWNP
jgi:Asp-tRNA(Asn)/Glu-tRNA(Gln) amidotransferase C subunit